MKKIFLLLIIIKTNLSSPNDKKNIPIIPLTKKQCNIFYKNDINDSLMITLEESGVENTEGEFLDGVITEINELKTLLEIGENNKIDSFQSLQDLLAENNTGLCGNKKEKIRTEYDTLIKISNTNILEIDFLIHSLDNKKQINPEGVNEKIKAFKNILYIIRSANNGLFL
jgi:hypothetical protein